MIEPNLALTLSTLKTLSYYTVYLLSNLTSYTLIKVYNTNPLSHVTLLAHLNNVLQMFDIVSLCAHNLLYDLCPHLGRCQLSGQ